MMAQFIAILFGLILSHVPLSVPAVLLHSMLLLPSSSRHLRYTWPSYPESQFWGLFQESLGGQFRNSPDRIPSGRPRMLCLEISLSSMEHQALLRVLPSTTPIVCYLDLLLVGLQTVVQNATPSPSTSHSKKEKGKGKKGTRL